MITPDTKDLIPRHSVEALCMAYNDALAAVQESKRMVEEANARLRAVWGEQNTPGGFTPYRSVQMDTIARDYDEQLLQSKREAWQNIIDRVGIRQLMSVKQQEELDAEIWGGSRYHQGKECKLPELTPENIYGWLARLSESLPDMFNAALAEVFEIFTPQRRTYACDDWKTNEQNRETVGNKVILSWFIRRDCCSGKPEIHYEHRKHITAIGNVFSMLQGKGPEQAPNDLATRLAAHFQTAVNGQLYEDELFRIRAYAGKGTLHIEFKRADLVAELNRRVGEAMPRLRKAG